MISSCLKLQQMVPFSPKDALKEAAKILIYHFMLFSDEKITLETQIRRAIRSLMKRLLHMRQLLKTRLVDMNLVSSCPQLLEGS